MSSTPYGISTSIGSQTFQGYVNSPIGGPLNSRQYPTTMPYHNYGILAGKRQNPPQFYPGQEPVYAQMLTNARAQYLRATSLSSQQKAVQDSLGKASNAYYKSIILFTETICCVKPRKLYSTCIFFYAN